MKKIAIIIPAYNEHENILILLNKLNKLKYIKTIIIIDDSSNDLTKNKITKSKNKVNTIAPSFIDFLGDVIDAPITDFGAPLLFVGISIIVYWRWGRYATVGIILAGSLTGLTRLSDVVERSGPNKDFIYNESKYYFGEGGYPSGHIVYAVMIFGMLAYLSRDHSSPRISRVVKSFMVFLILLNIWTRISGLHHWPGDVAGGLLMSLPALMIVIWIYRRVPSMLLKTPRLHALVFKN